MAATREDVDEWIKEAKDKKAKYIISVCDTFSYDDYPVFVMENEDLEEKKKEYAGVNMQKINEVIEIKYEKNPFSLVADKQIKQLSKMQVELLSTGISSDDYNIISDFIGNLKGYMVNCDSYKK